MKILCQAEHFTVLIPRAMVPDPRLEPGPSRQRLRQRPLLAIEEQVGALAPANAVDARTGRSLTVVTFHVEATEERGVTQSTIDAIKADFASYSRDHLEMMILKAYIGFAAARHDTLMGGHSVVATGHWGMYAAEA